MIHAAAATLAGVFVDTVSAPSVVVYCKEVPPASGLGWWASALAPWIGPLLSGFVSIYVAWRVFDWQGKKDRDTWIRDQKKAEWSAILSSLAEVDLKMPHVFKNDAWPTMSNEISQALRAVLPAMRSALFIENVLIEEELIARFTGFASSAAERTQEIDMHTQEIQALRSASATSSSNISWIDSLNKREAVYRAMYEDFHSLAYDLHQAARRSFMLEDKDDEITFSNSVGKNPSTLFS